MQQSETRPSVAALRRRVHEIIEPAREGDRTSRLTDAAITALILINIAAFVLESVEPIRAKYALWFHLVEIVSVLIFTVEYAARIWSGMEIPFVARMGPVRGRLRYALRPLLLIDLLAILPFYLSFLIPIDLRVLRALRLLRILKLARSSPSLHTLLRVLSSERRALAGTGVMLMVLLLLASTAAYYLEREAQPDKFGSIPEAAWWTMATLTTVGYGDVAPVTLLGRMLGSVVMLAGIVTLALPIAIIANGFANEVGKRDFVVTWPVLSRVKSFAVLDSDEATSLMGYLQSRILPARVSIIRQGEEPEAAYFVVSGQVERLTGSESQTLSVGDMFGAAAVLGDDVSSVTYRTLTRCRLLVLDRADYLEIDHKWPDFAEKLRDLGVASRKDRMPL